MKFNVLLVGLLLIAAVSGCGGGYAEGGNPIGGLNLSSAAANASVSSTASAMASSQSSSSISSVSGQSSTESASSNFSKSTSAVPFLLGGTIQRTLNLGADVSTVASFAYPMGMTTDGIDIYVLDNPIFDKYTYNGDIIKMVVATGEVFRLSGITKWSRGITSDGKDLYVATWQGIIFRVNKSTGEYTEFVQFNPEEFRSFNGITTDNINLYVTDNESHRIYKIAIATGSITKLAGSDANFEFGSADGIAENARFKSPKGITTDGINLYVADTLNCTIRKIVIATGLVTTLAGSAGNCGIADGAGAAASFYGPSGITTDGLYLYVSDSPSHIIRKIEITTGIVTTLAGTAGNPGNADGLGTAARFSYPDGLTSDGYSLYIADSANKTIRKMR